MKVKHDHFFLRKHVKEDIAKEEEEEEAELKSEKEFHITISFSEARRHHIVQNM